MKNFMLKLLATIVAYFHWNSWASDWGDPKTEYRLPSSLCTAFWMTLVNIILAVVGLVGTIINGIILIRAKSSTFSWQDKRSIIPGMFNIAFTLLPFVAGMAVERGDTFKEWFGPTGLLVMEDPIWYNLIGVWLIGLVTIATWGLIISAGLAILAGLYWLIVRPFKKKPFNSYSEATTTGQVIGAVTSRFCPKIDWDSLEE